MVFLVKYKQGLVSDRDRHIVIESDTFKAGNRISPVESVKVKHIVWCQRACGKADAARQPSVCAGESAQR